MATRTKRVLVGVTSPEGRKADKFVTTAYRVLLGLSDRWADEHDHENIQDYRKPLARDAKACGVKIKSMTAQPFGCLLSIGRKTYQVKVNRRSLSWYRVTR